MSNEFLKDVRVLDLSQFLPGPFATQMLADMGADVVKVEPPNGDPMRDLNPVTNERGPAPFHGVINAGKRIVRIDLKSNAGKSALEALVREADVLLESYRPGVLERLGFGVERLRELNSGLVHCALSGYGQTGPLRLASGHDMNYIAMTGALNVTGPADKPVAAFPPVADYGGALQAVIAIQGALFSRTRTGKGTFLDVAMADSILSWQASAMTQADQADEGPNRARDLLTGGAACYQNYETSDGKFISIGAIEEVFWKNFCEALERPDLISRQLEPLPQTDLIVEVAKLIRTQSRAYWDERLRTTDCCYHPVLEYGEVADWPQVIERQLVDGGRDGEAFESIRFPVWTDGKPPPKRKPVLETSVEDVLGDWSGD
jgi:alpha-methylacyl-CoA racemase